MYHVVGIENTFEISLPPLYKKGDSRITSTKLHLPPEEIVPTAEELWTGIKAMMNFILSGGKERKSANSNKPTYIVQVKNVTSIKNEKKQAQKTLNSGLQKAVEQGLNQ